MQLQHRQRLNPSEMISPVIVSEQKGRRLRDQVGVLVVDDEHLVRMVVQLSLERNGFGVWLAPNGRKAIDLYREHRDKIAVVLLDVLMPGLDGPQTLDALRELNPELPACFMSGYTQDYKVEDLRQRGAGYVIAKPFQLQELVNILRMLAQGLSANLLPSGKESPRCTQEERTP